MKREILASAVLHLVIIFLAVITSPFGSGAQIPVGEVIRVEVISLQDPGPVQPMTAPEIQQEQPPPVIPQPVVEEEPEVPISDPTTEDAAQIEPEPTTNDAPPSPAQTPTPTDAGAATSSEIHVPPTAGSSPLAGARIDNASFNYPYWFTQAFNKILRNWRNPVASDASIICVVYFQVIKSGRVVRTEVVESSGIQSFDDACLSAIQRSGPFPPLPRQFTDEVIGLTLPFKFEPR